MAKLTMNAADPRRFEVSRATLRADRFMTFFIMMGGLGIVVTVLAIFFFIIAKTWPLFTGADVEPGPEYPMPVRDFWVIGVDEWSELPFVLARDGTLYFLDLAEGGEVVHLEQPALLARHRPSAVRYDQARQQLAIGTETGGVCLIDIVYKPVYGSGGTRRITVGNVAASELRLLGNSPIYDLAVHQTASSECFLGLVEEAGGRVVRGARWRPRDGGESPLFAGLDLPAEETTWEKTAELTLDQPPPGEPERILLDATGTRALVLTDDSWLHAYRVGRNELSHVQSFEPFPESTLASVNWVFGGESLVLTSAAGENVIYSRFHRASAGAVEEERMPAQAEWGQRERHYHRTQTFPELPAGASFYASSLRNRSFLIGTEEMVSLRYPTTGSIRWEAALSFQPVDAVLGAKYETIFLAGADGVLRSYLLDDPHPEAGLQAFFGKIWYEGQPEPMYKWESTGASGEFEPKLSLMPLFFGSLKGTFYAMLFSVPIAIAAALYTSQFLKPEFRKFVKPSMELMASIPSVVLGFLGALWLAPLLESRFPSVLLMLGLLTASAPCFGFVWGRLPRRQRRWIRPGYEFLAFLPAAILLLIIGWKLGPVVETQLFAVRDPATGAMVGDFAQWWRQEAGGFTALVAQRFWPLLLMILMLPLPVLLFMLLKRRLPRDWVECLLLFGLTVAALVLGWQVGLGVAGLWSALENVAPDGALGDFARWGQGLGGSAAELLRSWVGFRYEPRNSIIVGFMMGFAVIPVIFTISEDAMSSVPPSLTSASLALGASRWQTAWRIVLPTAASGLFSATMIGFGRAAGETMIVLLATGNTAIMELNPFNGFRALSANIAVELPEAPQNSTLYRTLFLCGLLLFILTFVVNTIADILRNRLRERYRNVG